MDLTWRKRPTDLAASVAYQSAKRFKQSSAASSSDQTAGKDVQALSISRGASTSSNLQSQVKADRWFDDTNEHPRDMSFIDNDPPYYLKNQLSEYNRASATQSDNSSNNMSKIGPTAPTRSLLAQMDADNNNGDDFRSVIDDLTIENKKLRKKLKKYETLHCSHLQEEKLFEVRIHTLTANKKRELEETLRSFASSIDDAFPRRAWAITSCPPTDQKPAPLLHKPPSSTTSASKPPLDSAYASMSGQTVVASHSYVVEHHAHEQILLANRQNVKSYLHNIPDTLAPKSSVVMSDRSKSKAIVRKLEQLFTGKGAASRQHKQSQQQQEVSQLAALASGQRLGREGTREAHILSDDAQLQVDSMEDVKAQTSREGSDFPSLQVSQSGSPRCPEQRPTRPLDLDLHRAQVPSDNMEYIRHLGLASTAKDLSDGPQNKDGWVYLNLLTGMAQLHTLNVTTEFIRKAVADVSSKLELSPDQTKIRWMGGSAGTRMSSNGDEREDLTSRKPSGSSIGISIRDEVQEGSAARSHPAGDSATILGLGAKRRPVDLNEASNEDDTIQYQPLVFNTAVSDEDGSELESDFMSSSSSPDFFTATGINSGATALRDRATRLRGPIRKDGPMIFYNGARFCTDLSGDLEGARSKESHCRRFTHQPIGTSALHLDESDDGEVDEVKLSHGGQPASQDVGTDTNRSALGLEDLKPILPGNASSKNSRLDTVDMEASGLGGSRPADNFVVKVQVQYGDIDTFREMVDIPRSRVREASVSGEIISAVKTDMDPSALPPPSYVCLPFSSSESDDENDDEACMSLPTQAMDQMNCQPPTVQRDGTSQLRASMNTTNLRGEQSKYGSPTTISDDSDAESDDSSIDMLAHARGLDPETIAAREREFECNNRDLAEVPAGSSAATVGGGSGRASPRYADGNESDIDSMSVDGDESDDSD